MARYPALKVDKEAEMERYKKYAERIRPMVAETISYIHDKGASSYDIHRFVCIPQMTLPVLHIS